MCNQMTHELWRGQAASRSEGRRREPVRLNDAQAPMNGMVRDTQVQAGGVQVDPTEARSGQLGPAGRPDMARYRFIKWIDEGTPLTLYGDGTQARDFTCVDDIARGIVLAARTFGGQSTEDGGRMAVVGHQSSVVSRQRSVGVGRQSSVLGGGRTSAVSSRLQQPQPRRRASATFSRDRDRLARDRSRVQATRKLEIYSASQLQTTKPDH